MGDSTIAVFAYGIVARAARQAIRMAQHKRIRVGLIQPLTIWPFPDIYMEQMSEQLEHIIVAELNQGQLLGEVMRTNCGKAKVHGLNRFDGDILTPEQIFAKIREVR